MATGPGKELDLTRLVVIVLFLIVGGIYCRTFFYNYVSGPARAADRVVGPIEKRQMFGPSMASPRLLRGPLRDYITTGDEQAKQRLIQDTKRRWRNRHSLEIWGSLAVACISIIIVVSVGLPILLNRRA